MTLGPSSNLHGQGFEPIADSEHIKLFLLFIGFSNRKKMQMVSLITKYAKNQRTYTVPAP
jgi:hypothetical protein